MDRHSYDESVIRFRDSVGVWRAARTSKQLAVFGVRYQKSQINAQVRHYPPKST
jgi:hypothetical protein